MKSVALCILFCISIINYGQCNMSEAQVKSAQKLMRSVCQPKTKATNAQIENMHKGEFSDERELMCYMECVLRTAQIMKDGKLNYESMRTQVSNLPESILDVSLAATEKCKDSAKDGDKCLAANQFYKCFYEQTTDNFFLP